MQKCLKQNTCCYECMYKLGVICSEDATYWATLKKADCCQRQCITHSRAEYGILCFSKLIPSNTSLCANSLSELTLQNVGFLCKCQTPCSRRVTRDFCGAQSRKILQWRDIIYNQGTEYFCCVFVKGPLVFCWSLFPVMANG